jgi:hypothetical protein
MEEKREVRFLLKKEIYDRLKKEAEEKDIALASYIKSKVLK